MDTDFENFCNWFRNLYVSTLEKRLQNLQKILHDVVFDFVQILQTEVAEVRSLEQRQLGFDCDVSLNALVLVDHIVVLSQLVPVQPRRPCAFRHLNL